MAGSDICRRHATRMPQCASSRTNIHAALRDCWKIYARAVADRRAWVMRGKPDWDTRARIQRHLYALSPRGETASAQRAYALATRPMCYAPMRALWSGRHKRRAILVRRGARVWAQTPRRSAQTRPLRRRLNARAPDKTTTARAMARAKRARASGRLVGAVETTAPPRTQRPTYPQRATDTAPHAVNIRSRRDLRRNDPRALCAADCTDTRTRATVAPAKHNAHAALKPTYHPTNKETYYV